MTKPGNTTDPDKYINSGYGLGFDITGQFTHPQGRMVRNIIIFGVDSSNSAHATNKTRNILILEHGLTQKINNTTIYAEKIYSPNFSAENKTFCLNLHYNGHDSYLFVNAKEFTKFKAKDSEIKANQLTLGSISTSANLSSSDIRDSRLYGNIYDFDDDYSASKNDETLDIHNYLMKKNNLIQMLRYIKKCFFTAITFFSSSLLNVNSSQCVSMNIQECKIRPKIIKLNTNEPLFYPYSIKIKKCKGSCNTIMKYVSNHKICVPDDIKSTNVKVFNLMSRANETRYIERHKTCKCKYRLDVSVCNNKHGMNKRWNEDKCKRECKELTDKGLCDEGFIWNLGNCECECDESCDVGEHLDYKNCKFTKKIIDKLLEECSENVYENETLDIIQMHVYKKVCNSCMVYIILFFIFLKTSICICSAFICFHWYLKKDHYKH